MIEKLIAKSRVTEVDAVSMRLTGAYKTTGLNTDLHLLNMFDTLEPLSATLSSAINRIKAESILEEKDEIRDNEVRALFYLVMGFVHHPDAAVKNAAHKVEKIFEKYGMAITNESYATESSLIVSLLEDLSKQKLQDAIAQLSGCAETIAALQAAQTDFEASRIAYEQKKAEEGTQKNATTIKKEVVALINDKIVVYLRAMGVVDEPSYGSFARTVAEIIANNNEVVKKRAKTPVEIMS